MPEKVVVNAAFASASDPIVIEREHLRLLYAAVMRLRELPGAECSKEELKAIARVRGLLKREGLKVQIKPERVEDRYGDHMTIPEDWEPNQATAAWVARYLGELGRPYSERWLVEEFRTYWRGNGRPMANWNQCFRNNIIKKVSRGMYLAPSTETPGRLRDRHRELNAQRIADLDSEISGWSASAPARRPVGEDR